MVMMMHDSKRKNGRPATTLKNTLKNDLRNISMLAGINGTNFLDGTGRMEKNM